MEAAVISCCVLHNLMRVRYPALQNGHVDQEDPVTHAFVEGTWRDDVPMHALTRLQARGVQSKAADIRKYLVHYVNNAGTVAWQDAMI